MQLLLFGFAVEPRALSAVALRSLEDCAPLLLGIECALDACHWVFLSRSVSGVRGLCQPFSILLTRVASLAATVVRPSRRRVRVVDLCSRRWRRPAFWRTILPVPVLRNRFEAPLWVLALGMGPQFCWVVSGLSSGCASAVAAGPCGRCVGASASCAALARVFAPRCGASTIVMFRPSCLAD